jgi:hypothetical protein
MAVVGASLLLAACAGGTGGSGPLAGLFGGGTGSAAPAAKEDYSPDFFLKSGYCPPVQIRPGTETLATYEKGHDGEPDFVRTQASMTSTARECNVIAPDTMVIKVGIAGRVVGGPVGKPEVVTVPIRIAVSKQSTGAVLFSQIYVTKVTLTAPSLAADLTQVFDQVSFKLGPADRDLQVFVGFDDKPDPKAKGKPVTQAKPKAGT